MIPSHYNSDYFKWQKDIGNLTGIIDNIKFKKYIKETDSVLDFGCGGGFILKNIPCKLKMGVEINPTAREQANLNGLQTYESIEKVPDESADVIISHHALEHTPNPLSVLKSLYKKLKKDGIFICVVPTEGIAMKYNDDDVNQHLFSWSPLNIGNLFKHAGYQVDESKAFKHTWPPGDQLIFKLFGKKVFHLLSRIRGLFSHKLNQVRVLARRKN